MDALLDPATQLAGIAFDPHIRGVLIVLTAVGILCGSIYLIIGTNVGARLGFQVAAGGLMGWMLILGVTWWLTPPAIGPRGHTPSWEIIDIVRGDPSTAAEEIVTDLPHTCWSSASLDCEPVEGTGTLSAQLLSENPEWVEEAGEDATLSEILNVEPQAVDDVDFGEWRMISAAEAGEALSAADEELKAEEIFTDSAQYIVLDAWEQGGKEQLPSDPTRMDRIWNKIETTAQLRHPPHYAAVQVIPVLPQETEPGEAPPTPVADEDQYVYTIVMERNLGNTRVPGALVTIGSGALLAALCYSMHRRDKLAMAHQAAG
jgi:hypothetical protein